MKKSLIALAFGTLGLGIAEFVMMGILPDVAHDFGISISQAGHFISAYALGVCVGAPMLILARKHPLKRILLILVTLIMVGNISAALAPNYWILLLARFISGAAAPPWLRTAISLNLSPAACRWSCALWCSPCSPWASSMPGCATGWSGCPSA